MNQKHSLFLSTNNLVLVTQLQNLTPQKSPMSFLYSAGSTVLILAPQTRWIPPCTEGTWTQVLPDDLRGFPRGMTD